MLKAVIFDLHGTLIHTIKGVSYFMAVKHLTSKGYDISP